MKLVVDGNRFRMAKITGPSHNFLGLTLSKDEPCDDPLIKNMTNNTSTVLVDSEKVKEQVMQGLRFANKYFEKNYTILEIEFDSSDTPSESIYNEITQEIIKTVDSKDLLKTK